MPDYHQTYKQIDTDVYNLVGDRAQANCANETLMYRNATLAQLAERLTRNEKVDSSILSSGSQ